MHAKNFVDDLSGISKYTLAAGALANLLGTGLGRRISVSALLPGDAVAYQAYQNRRGQQAKKIDEPGKPVERLGDANAAISTEPLQATIIAAMADGRIDSDERAPFEGRLAGWAKGLEGDLARFIATQLQRPPGPANLAAQAISIEAASGIRMASRLVFDADDLALARRSDELVAASGLELPCRAKFEIRAAAVG